MMDYTTLGAGSKEGQEQPAKVMQSLYEVCQQVKGAYCSFDCLWPNGLPVP